MQPGRFNHSATNEFKRSVISVLNDSRKQCYRLQHFTFTESVRCYRRLTCIAVWCVLECDGCMVSMSLLHTISYMENCHWFCVGPMEWKQQNRSSMHVRWQYNSVMSNICRDIWWKKTAIWPRFLCGMRRFELISTVASELRNISVFVSKIVKLINDEHIEEFICLFELIFFVRQNLQSFYYKWWCVSVCVSCAGGMDTCLCRTPTRHHCISHSNIHFFILSQKFQRANPKFYYFM